MMTAATATDLIDPETMRPSDRFILSRYEDGAERRIVVEITGDREPHVDMFGRDQFKYMARREDTGKTGYMIYGFGAMHLQSAGPRFYVVSEDGLVLEVADTREDAERAATTAVLAGHTACVHDRASEG